MRLSKTLGIEPGVVAVIGGGGKTSLLLRLAEELKEKGRVILCATAKMHLPKGMQLTAPNADEIEAAFALENPVCVGIRTTEGKLTLDIRDIELLRSLAPYVLCEADGSKGLPLKAHAPHEPVVPAEANRVICVVGIDGIGKPIQESAHRPELYAALLSVEQEYIVAPRDAARVIVLENLHDTVFINKVETEQRLALARELAKELTCPVFAGALQQRERKICLLS